MLSQIIVEPDPQKALARADILRQKLTQETSHLHNHPDIILINPSSKTEGQDLSKTDSIKIEHIRSLTKEINLKPIQLQHKIAIINQAQLITPTAQHTLLKTLEEPPTHALIILTVDNPSHLLDTILSRCIVHTQQITEPQVVDPKQLKLLQLILTTPEYKRLKLTDQFSKTRQLASEFCTKQLELLHYHIAHNQPLQISDHKQLTKAQLVELTKAFLQTYIYLQSNTHTTLTIDNLLLALPNF